MRRALVLTNEAARHPFRQQLPVKALAVPAALMNRSARSTMRNVMTVFAAGFAGVYTFIA
jgi:hypothetical protein